MMNSMSDYFVAEKQESIIFIVVGLLATGFSLWLSETKRGLRQVSGVGGDGVSQESIAKSPAWCATLSDLQLE